VRARVIGLPLVAVGAAGFVACLVCVYSGMRDVMRTSGGFCASGGPYAIAPGHQCSSGDVRLMLVGILGGLVFAGVVAAATGWLEGSVVGVSLLMWSALFGALGWNFLQLAINPPKGQSSTGGWIASGAVFELMALGGLIPVLIMLAGWLRRGGRAEPAPTPIQPLVKAAVPGGLGQSNWWSSS
jgi:hypothetical protein